MNANGTIDVGRYEAESLASESLRKFILHNEGGYALETLAEFCNLDIDDY